MVVLVLAGIEAGSAALLLGSRSEDARIGCGHEQRQPRGRDGSGETLRVGNAELILAILAVAAQQTGEVEDIPHHEGRLEKVTANGFRVDNNGRQTRCKIMLDGCPGEDRRDQLGMRGVLRQIVRMRDEVGAFPCPIQCMTEQVEHLDPGRRS